MTAATALAFASDPPRRPPSKTLTLAIAVSLGVHAAGAMYLAYLKFTPPPAPPIEKETLIETEIVHLPKAPPETPPVEQPKPVQLHAPVPNPVPTDIAPIPLLPVPVADLQPFAPPTQIAQAPPPAPAARDPLIRNPTWLRKPGANEYSRFYPDRAMRLEKSGQATLSCQVTASGAVTACRVTAETPTEFGFGDAAMKLSKFFKMSPRTVDGLPVEGGQVSIPITFKLTS